MDLEKKEITESTSTYLVSQTSKFGISTIGLVNLTVSQYLSYAMLKEWIE